MAFLNRLKTAGEEKDSRKSKSGEGFKKEDNLGTWNTAMGINSRRVAVLVCNSKNKDQIWHQGDWEEGVGTIYKADFIKIQRI